MIEFNEEELSLNRKGRLWLWVNAIIILFSIYFVEFFFKVLNRSKVYGAENIVKGGGVLFAANHCGWADTLLLPISVIERWSLTPFLAPAKEELFKIPVISQVITVWGAFPVKRRARDTEAMKKIAYLTKNYRTMIFAEGTRSRNGELLRGRSGVGWIVYAAQPVVVPTLLINTDQFSAKGIKRFLFAPYRIVFGKPLDLSKYYEAEDCKETSQAIADEIMRAIAAMRVEYKDLYIEPPKLTGYYYDNKEDVSSD